MDTDRLPARKSERLSGLKTIGALKEVNTDQSISKNKSSYFPVYFFSGRFAEYPWQTPFPEVVSKPG
jgi:hypothetical protein